MNSVGDEALVVLEDSLTYRGLAQLVPEPENPHDSNAIAVIVNERRVGYIARTKAPRLRRLIGDGTTVSCTVFWNGDPDDDFQFYTVQLFSLPPSS